MTAAPGSFRDPQGRVFEYEQRIFRALFAPLAPFPETWNSAGPLAPFFDAGILWPARPLKPDEAPPALAAEAPGAVGFLEHPRLDPITFPFEWPFALLKKAALMHLGFHRDLLKRGLTLSDGYAYNVQFVGGRPVFIDALAVVPYVEGQPWAGYAQFCESFLNPLLLASRGCETWQDQYRGRMRGIPTREVARQLGWWGAMRAGAFVHVYLSASVETRAAVARAQSDRPMRKPAGFSKGGLDLMLASLERSIRKLVLPGVGGVHWGDYEGRNSYATQERELKHRLVREFVQRHRPTCLLDIGCNAGEYSELALDAGAESAVGFERDGPAVQRAAERSMRLLRPFLPLQIDIQNPSPALGWANAERRALRERVHADALLCLALIHHLSLAEGVPLERVIPEVISWAPRGLIEFVPPEDPMARRVAGPVERLTHPYDFSRFLSILESVATVENQTRISADGRVLVEFHRKQ